MIAAFAVGIGTAAATADSDPSTPTARATATITAKPAPPRPKTVKMPRLIGKSGATAQNRLVRLGIPKTYIKFAPTVPTGQITKQFPKPGTPLKPGTKIVLTTKTL
ncbi:PASTA domain-containing protein [Spirillospora sp. CA-294931]|uniref:PASTA domain-containing protein n=1 Tax=Spirillospora sp. CA-294931 TaxID=3240042 RepID=UPI003D9445CD